MCSIDCILNGITKESVPLTFEKENKKSIFYLQVKFHVEI